MKRNFRYNKQQGLLYLILAIFLLFISLYTYNQTNELKPAETFSVSSSDIEEAKIVVKDYFSALQTSDTVILNDYLGYNMTNLGEIGPCNINSNNGGLDYLYDFNFKPELIKIDTSSKYSFDPSYYANEIKNQNNIDVFKIVNLHVYFNYKKERDWDFILVKYTESSPWKIHLWID